MSTTRVAAVTGANKGIGLAIVRQLALRYPDSQLNTGPLLIYLTARSAERGATAVETVKGDAQLQKARVLAQDGGQTTIEFRELDISDATSARDFAAALQKDHPEGIDILVNNAGIAMTGFDSNVVKQTLDTNYYGTLHVTELLLPMIKPGGRVVNVASMSGHLDKYSESVREAFISASQTGVTECTALMEKFKAAVAQGKEKEAGFPSAAYAVSKAGIIAMTMAMAKQLAASDGRNVLINACCPGFVQTDMTRGRGSKTPDDGASTPVLLSLGDIGEQTGKFWQHEKVIEW